MNKIIIPFLISNFLTSSLSLAVNLTLNLQGNSSGFQIPNGCAPGITYAYKIANDLWLCAPDATTGNNTFVQMATACNTAQNFYLATVGPMTARGAPTSSQWDTARAAASSAGGFDYVTTGQPTRGFAWNRSSTPYESTGCGSGGTGYIGITETVSNSNWAALLDGNSAEYRTWPAANCVEVSYHRLIALCHNASSIPGAYVYDYRWRK